ncbi:hypothetical protein XaFJ1_GM003134 [Xanthomonas albilineans]|nr:hypothetical protein XaFJ1_GM003134 [Xanthomonas albilineans]
MAARDAVLATVAAVATPRACKWQRNLRRAL